MTPGTFYDIVVVGGGLLGAALARDAAQRGLSTALFAPEDFGTAEGQHSRLALGSLGALETLDFTRVREDCREREILVQTAPQFVRPQPCLIPFYSPGLLAQTRLRASLALSDALAFDPLQHFDPALLHFDPPLRVHQMLSAAEVRRHAPRLRTAGLTGAARVWEARVQDPARLALATALDARRHGAMLFAHLSAEEIVQEPGPHGRTRVTGIGWTDRLTGETGRTRAALVLVADGSSLGSGVGIEELGRLGVLLPKFVKSVTGRVSSPVGIGAAGTEDALALPGSDGALRFVVPGTSGSIVGPWETDLPNSCDPAYATGAEIALLMEPVSPFLPGLTPDSVHAAEVRVRTTVTPGRQVHDPSADGGRLEGLLTVSGSTLTTARRLAEDTIDLACRKLGRSLAVPPCRTAVTPLPLTPDRAALSLPAAVEYAVTQEECRTLRDFVTRSAAPWEESALPAVSETMARLLGWDAGRQTQELKAWHAAQALPQTFRVL